jgi:hypothetical protein
MYFNNTINNTKPKNIKQNKQIHHDLKSIIGKFGFQCGYSAFAYPLNHYDFELGC